MPPLRDDNKLYSLSVLPYLEEYYYCSASSSEYNNSIVELGNGIKNSGDYLTESLSHLSFQNNHGQNRNQDRNQCLDNRQKAGYFLLLI